MRYFVIFNFLILISVSFAQKIEKDLYLRHSLKMDGLSYNFKVLASDEKGVSRYDKEKFYYWFKSQKVISTQGGASGSLLHGTFECFYENKQLSQKGEFKKGLKHGEWIYWQPDGSMTLSEHWKNGSLTGKQMLYDANGKLTETVHYKRNSQSRKTADSLIISNEDKTKQTIYTFDSIGNIQSKVAFENGVQEGKAKFYSEGKLIKTEVYHKGKPEMKAEKHENGEAKEKKPLFWKKWFTPKDEKTTKTKEKSKNQETVKGKKKDKQAEPKKTKESKPKERPSKKKDGNSFFDFFRKKKKD